MKEPEISVGIVNAQEIHLPLILISWQKVKQ